MMVPPFPPKACDNSPSLPSRVLELHPFQSITGTLQKMEPEVLLAAPVLCSATIFFSSKALGGLPKEIATIADWASSRMVSKSRNLRTGHVLRRAASERLGRRAQEEKKKKEPRWRDRER